MKVLLITLGFQPVRMSGFDVGGELVTNALREAGHQVTVVACEKMDLHVEPQEDTWRIPLGRTNWIGYGYQAAQLVARLTKNDHYDVVHFWDVHFAWAYPGRYIATVHQSFHQRTTSYHSPVPRRAYYLAAKYLAEKPSLQRASHLMAVSQATRDEFVNHYHIPADKITLAPMGIDCEKFRPRPELRQPVRDRLGIKPGEQVLFYSGFMTPRKGIEYLLEAIQKIPSPPKVVLAGRWDPAYRKQLEDLMNSVRSQIIELGYIADEEMPGLYAAADLYVSPSQLEGFGLPFAESLASGTPVIAADSGSAKEVVGPGGLLVKTRDSDELSGAIRTLLQDDDRRLQYRKMGLDHIYNHYRTPLMRDKILEGYAHFMANGK